MGEIRSVGDEYQKLKVFEELNSTESCVPTGDLSPGSEGTRDHTIQSSLFIP